MNLPLNYGVLLDKNQFLFRMEFILMKKIIFFEGFNLELYIFATLTRRKIKFLIQLWQH